MQLPQSINIIPLWAVFCFTIVMIFLAVEIGHRVSLYQKKRVTSISEASICTVVAATLGLLAFMLTFTFGLAGSRFENRRQLVLEEANAIGKTYLRAGYLDEPERSNIRKLIREYVSLKLTPLSTSDTQSFLEKADRIQDELWDETLVVAKKSPTSPRDALFIQAVSDVIDYHSKRLLEGFISPIPTIIWVALVFLTFVSMISLGYMIGLSGSRNYLATLTLNVGFTCVIYLIADLDRPREGVIRTNLQPIADLQKRMQER